MGFNKAFEDKKFMIFYVRKLSRLDNFDTKVYEDDKIILFQAS